MYCVVNGCHRELDEDDDLGICGACGIKIARRYKQRILAEERMEHERQRAVSPDPEKIAYDRALEALLYKGDSQPPGTSFVYYLRLGDHIKIGYTTRVRGRISALRTTTDNLLALEPGTYTTEQARHQQFAHLRISQRWENFMPGDDLMAHIDKVHEEYGMPNWVHSTSRRSGRSGPVRIIRKAEGK